ncbi:MAG: hypothetical protein GY856_44265, partial [bacterium]|nr:hypothetical protein [bacterium]
ALLAAGFAPSDLPSGSPVPYLLAQQQADGSWEGNEFVTAQVMRVLHGELPNLIVTEVTATPQTATPGTLVKISMIVRNVGPVDAGAAYVAVRLDTAAGEELAETALPALAAGATTTIEVDVDAADRTGDARERVAVTSVTIRLGSSPRSTRITWAVTNSFPSQLPSPCCWASRYGTGEPNGRSEGENPAASRAR